MENSNEKLFMTTILYGKGEWEPELLSEEVRRNYQFYAVCVDETEYQKALEDTMIEKEINPKQVLFIAATDAGIKAAKGLSLAVIGYINPAYKGQSLTQARMLVEGFEEVDELFLERAFQREHHLPWTIATNPRWVLREFTMEDMDALENLYNQPGVTYQMDEKGHCIPGYIESLLPRNEEEEYQRCYIENMYGYYGYGMWIVTDPGLNCVIGRAGLEHREYADGVELEMGYVIDPRWQHRGIAYEVCSAIMKYAAENLDFERLNALTEADNVASIALLEKLGFTYLEDTDVSGSRTRRYVYMLK